MMGRRTAWWGARARHSRLSTHARVAVVSALLCATAALPGPYAAATGTASPYAFAEGDRSVTGATSTADAELLEPGMIYRSSLPAGGRLYYRLELDAASTVYVPATAVPPAGTTVSAGDGIKVSVQDADSRSCSVESASIGASRSPHPLTALAKRESSRRGTYCRGAGTYYVLVERVDTGGSSPGTWDLELAPVSEPGLRQTAATSAPEVWNSASPEPLPGEAVRRRGGSGFTKAGSLGQGVWRDDLRPGQTRFYEVPVDWGQQLYATAELAGSNSGPGYVPGALNISLYNPVRGYVADAGVAYNGSQKSAALEPLPPVAYANRYATSAHVNTVRFAGSYYLVVHLAAQVADRFGDGPLGLTLRVRVKGAAEAGPGYAGRSEPPGVFEVTTQARETVPEGGSAGGDTAMRLVAVGGIGGGTLLLVVLGVWTGLARRRSRAW